MIPNTQGTSPDSESTSTAVAPPPREALLQGVNLLPASPQILARLDPLLANAGSSVQDVTGLLRRDPALTARIIRIANSVIYNRGEPVASIEEALLRIGFSEVYRVTGFAVMAQVTNQRIPLYDITGAQFRENSLLTALIVEALAKHTGADPRLAYTAGLLRSTGKIALDRAIRGRTGDGEVEPYHRGPLSEWELGTFGMTNGEAAAIVLEAWRFPTAMVEAVRDHATAPAEAELLTRLLHLAAAATERCGHGLPGEFACWELTPEAYAAAHLDELALDDAMRAALEAFGPVRAALA